MPSPDALKPWGQEGPPEPGTWCKDVLGDPYEAFAISVGEDQEGPLVATLVRRNPAKGSFWRRAAAPTFALLYLHGRNDYFFHDEAATAFAEMGGAFFALDLKKYGRSLRPWQTIGYTTDLRDYDADLDAAVAAIRQQYPQLPLVIFAHSMGGLIATLWANRNPGVLAGLILNSAWLELQSLTQFRPALNAAIGPIAKIRPRTTIVAAPKNDNYHRSLAQGWINSGFPLPAHLQDRKDDPGVSGWRYHKQWKRPFSYAVPAAWMHTILEGHAAIEKDTHLDCPVLSLTATKQGDETQWDEDVFGSDIVLNPNVVNLRAAALSDNVALARFPGRHDLLLSNPDVRLEVFTTIRRWLSYVGIT